MKDEEIILKLTKEQAKRLYNLLQGAYAHLENQELAFFISETIESQGALEE